MYFCFTNRREYRDFTEVEVERGVRGRKGNEVLDESQGSRPEKDGVLRHGRSMNKTLSEGKGETRTVGNSS